jgi:hypothetical protein
MPCWLKQLFCFIALSALMISVQAHGVSLGQASANALRPVQLLREVFSAAAVLLGIYFIFSGVQRYMRHRRNKQEQPIGRVIMCFAVGFAFIGLTLAYRYSVTTAGEHGMGDLVDAGTPSARSSLYLPLSSSAGLRRMANQSGPSYGWKSQRFSTFSTPKKTATYR